MIANLTSADALSATSLRSVSLDHSIPGFFVHLSIALLTASIIGCALMSNHVLPP